MFVFFVIFEEMDKKKKKSDNNTKKFTWKNKWMNLFVNKSTLIKKMQINKWVDQPHWLNCKQADTGVQSVASLVSLAKTETIYLSSPAKNPPSWRSFRQLF